MFEKGNVIKRISRFLVTMILAVTAVLSGFVGKKNIEIHADDPVNGSAFTEEQVHEIDGTTYRFQAFWANVQSDSTNEYHYKDDGTLVFTPQDVRSKTDAQLYLKLSIEGETINDHPAGSIKFVLPGYVFEDWDGNPTGTLNTQIPKAPETNNVSDFNYTIDENTGDIIVTNWRTITGAATLTSTFIYSTSPSAVPGGWEEDGEYAGPYYQGHKAVSCSIDIDGDNVDNDTFSQELDLEYHTQVYGTANKSQNSKAYLNGVYYSWDGSWGEKPADADDYFYVAWFINYATDYNSTQPWYITVHETDADGGELIAMVTGDTVSRTNSQSFKDSLDLSAHGERTMLEPGGNITFGSILYSVLIKYPYTMLEEAIANGVDVLGEGLTIHNTAAVIEHWKSGHEETRECSATTKIRFDERGLGDRVFKKVNWTSNYYGGARTHTIPSAQSVLDLNTPVELYNGDGRAWEMFYTGTASGVAWDEDLDTYVNSEHTIVIEDNNPEIASSSIERPFAWETEYTTLSDDDYQYTALYIGGIKEYDATYSRGSWQRDKSTKTNVNEPPIFDVYVRYANTSEYVYYTSNTDLKYLGWGEEYYLNFGDHLYGKRNLHGSLAFPDNVAGFKIVYTTDAFQTNFVMRPVVTLKPTETVLNIVREDLEDKIPTYVRNTAYLTETINGGSTVSIDHLSSHEGDVTCGNNILDLAPFKSSTKLQKTSFAVQDDPVNEIQKTTERLMILTNNANIPEEFRDYYFLDKGTVYDLLPYGTDIDFSSVTVELHNNRTVTAAGGSPSPHSKMIDVPYEIEVIENWENSGRKMVLFHYEVPESQNYTNRPATIDGRSVYIIYDLVNSYTNIRDKGINAIDTFALVPETENRVTFDSGQGIDKISERQYYQNLETENAGNIAYAQATVTYKPLTVLQSGLVKSSKSSISSVYGNDDTVQPKAGYSYRLSYTSGEKVKTDKLVLYDVLEAGNKLYTSEWHGTLNYVDLSSIGQKKSYGSAVKCDPKLYYSTTAREQLLTEDRQLKDEYEDLTNPVWTDIEPADKSTITAVAIDCRKNTDGTDFVLSGGEILVAYVHMIAPADNTLKTKKAVNSFYSEARTYATLLPESEETDRLTNYAMMTMDAFDPDISKEADPAGGTEAAPVQIETGIDLSYTIHLTNTSTLLPYKNAIVADDVPEGMTIHTDQIKAYTDDAASAKVIAECDGVTLTSSGQHLEFLIDELKAGKSIHFIIPVTVIAEEGILKNTPVVKSIDDVELNIPGEPVVHEVNSKITIHILKTNNTGTIPLPGTQFQLTGTETDITAATDEEGIATFEEIKTGEYLIKEIKASPGYQLSGTTWTVTVANGTATIKDPEGNVLASTLNSDEEQVFQIKDGEPIMLLSTGGSGTGKFALSGGILLLIAFGFIRKKIRNRKE